MWENVHIWPFVFFYNPPTVSVKTDILILYTHFTLMFLILCFLYLWFSFISCVFIDFYVVIIKCVKYFSLSVLWPQCNFWLLDQHVSWSQRIELLQGPLQRAGTVTLTRLTFQFTLNLKKRFIF